ncbi:MAG: diaminopropionate ammonia-lyase [Nocardioides sp.]
MTHFDPDVLWNPAWEPQSAAGPELDRVAAFHRSIDGFHPSPLVQLASVSTEAGVRRVYAKHERDRLGLPSFKVVGASWAVAVAVADHLGDAPYRTFDELRTASAAATGLRLSTATDGNHGRAVAHMARLLGLRSRIFVPSDMATARVEAIRGEGAEVVVVPATYDDTVEWAARESQRAQADGTSDLLVSDTSWEGYTRIPDAVVEGYSTIFAETREQLADLTESAEAAGRDHVDVAVVPAGVGAFASAAVRYLRDDHCSVVAAEPVAADCVWRSLAAGRRVTVPGPHASGMAGLNCGEVSWDAWPHLQRGVRAAVRVTDLEAELAVRDLAAAGVDASESGAASLAGLRRLRLDSRAGSLLRPSSTIVLFVTEGVTDAAAHHVIVHDRTHAEEAS